jgi:hypothetical protein
VVGRELVGREVVGTGAVDMGTFGTAVVGMPAGEPERVRDGDVVRA